MKKGFILGFLCAAILFTAIGAGAYTLVPSPVKLVVDGTEMKDLALPVLYLEPGYNYIPAALFKKICSTIGTDFNYIGSTDTIEINTQVEETAINVVKEGDNVSETTDKITQTPDGITRIDTWEGKQYIGYSYVQNKVREKGYDLVKENDARVKSQERRWQFVKGDTILIENVPMVMTYGYGSIEVDYYINTILPLMQ